MKKWISLLLSILMIFSCMNLMIAVAADDEGQTTSQQIADLVGVDFTQALENPDLSSVIPSQYLDAEGEQDLEDLLASDDLQNVDFLGLNLNFMYKSQEPLSWSKISFSKSDLTMIYGNINSYIAQTLQAKFLKGSNSYKLYTAANATLICNYIGHLLFPDYTDQVITFSSNPTTYTNFYTTIAKRSGFTNLVKTQWIDQPNIKYRPLLFALGFDYYDLKAPDVDLKNATTVSARLIRDILEKQIMGEGPYAYLISVFKSIGLTYSLYMYDAVKAIFAYQIQAGKVSASDLKSLRTLLNMFFNFNNPNDTTHLQMLTPPTYRFIKAKDDGELFLYLLTYLNLVGIYKNNANLVNRMKERINNSSILSNTQKSRINTIIAATFESKIADLGPLNEELTTEAIDGIGNNVKKGLLDFLGRMLDSITSLFDLLFRRIRAFL